MFQNRLLPRKLYCQGCYVLSATELSRWCSHHYCILHISWQVGEEPRDAPKNSGQVSYLGPTYVMAIS